MINYFNSESFCCSGVLMLKGLTHSIFDTSSFLFSCNLWYSSKRSWNGIWIPPLSHFSL